MFSDKRIRLTSLKFSVPKTNAPRAFLGPSISVPAIEQLVYWGADRVPRKVVRVVSPTLSFIISCLSSSTGCHLL